LANSNIKELFFRDRMLHLRLPWLQGRDLTLSEKAMRRLVLALTALFLLVQAAALVTLLFQNRGQHLADENQLTFLRAQQVAQNMKIKQLQQPGLVPSQQLLEDSVPEEALDLGRSFLLVDGEGRVVASLPTDAAHQGKPIADILGSKFVTDVPVNAPEMVATTLVNGDEAFMTSLDLGGMNASLLSLQKKADVLSVWRSRVTQISMLGAVTLLVLMMLAGAFHWQVAKAADADHLLALATTRMDKALIGGECGLWDWNLYGGEIFWSQSMYDILGLTPKSSYLTFAEVTKRIHPEDAKIDVLTESLLKGESKVFDQEFRMRHVDGHWVWLRARAALAPGKKADEPHLVGVVFDVTRQKKLDLMNREAEVRLKDAVENISEAFVLWDTDSKLVLCNSKYQQFHSLPAQVCEPGTPYKIVTEAAKEPLVRQFVPGQADDASGARSMEVQFADGRWLHINERRTMDGGFVSVGTDITALKQQEEHLLLSERNLMITVRDLQKERQLAEEQAQRLADLADKYNSEKTRAEAANRSKSEFLANMSHELRTPLNAIIGFSEIMGQEMFGPLGSNKYGEYAMDIRRSGQFLLDVINDILDMSKIEAGKVELEMETVNPVALIEDVLRLVGPRAAEGKITLQPKLEKSKAFLADRRALKQVFINLISNAIKFTPEGGTVSISATRLGDQQRFEIIDTGIGIPQRDLEKIGRPFEQVENQFTKTKGGSGLGLAISKSLVHLHGGSLTIASKVGKGTTVVVELPAKQA
jgi:two-component system cell cycle sensor histidine kinase PleC